MHKVKFNNKVKPLRDLLDERIKEYFKTAQIPEKGNWTLYSKTIILFTLLLATYFSTVFFLPQTWWLLVPFAFIGFVKASIGFNVMHDAAHGSYSRNLKLNNFIAFMGGDFIGGSTFFWKIKHNILHHTFTNIDGIDDDIAKYPTFRLSPEQEPKWFHKYQWLYGVPLYSLLSLNWIVADDWFKLLRKKINTTPITTIKAKDRFWFVFGKLLNISVFIVVPFIFLPWQIALVGYLVMHATLGVTLAVVFQMAHIVEHTDFPVPDESTNRIENEWAAHQVATTANFAMKNKAISWFVGGLNYQIEHHLYPRISHIHYPNISKIVQETCEELEIKYHAFPTFWQAFVSHIRFLKRLGTA